MTKPSRKTVYADAGIQYDELWPRDQKVAWNRAHSRLLRPILAGAKSVCELGCGTGNRACEFARRGLRVYAVDLSAAMLWAARLKARRANLPIHFMQADMRSFRLPQRVDLINSEWGAVNHIPRKTDLLRVARAVSRALRPGGYFVFDVNHRRVFDEIWAETDIRETSKLFMVQRGGYDQRRGKGWLEVTWFVPGRRRGWKRFHQRIEETHWSETEILRTLRESGFEHVQVFDFAVLVSNSRVPLTIRGYKSVFLARRTRD
ncbi:MAG: class I SAM-dependent methyltransferase [Candidatus Acidiferrales bacterium]